MAPKDVSDLIIGRHPVAEALRAGVSIKRIFISPGAKPAPILQEIRELAEEAGLSVQTESRTNLDRLAGGKSHQGVVATAAPFDYHSAEDLLGQESPHLVLLDGVTDPANLGSILRSSEAFGWSGVLVPRRRSVGVTPAVRKVAAGAAERVPVALVGSAADAVLNLTKQGVFVVGLDPEAGMDYREVDYEQPICLVLGAEGPGLSRLVRERADALISIPMRGRQASINVAVAAAVVMVEVTRVRG